MLFLMSYWHKNNYAISIFEIARMLRNYLLLYTEADTSIKKLSQGLKVVSLSLSMFSLKILLLGPAVICLYYYNITGKKFSFFLQ